MVELISPLGEITVIKSILITHLLIALPNRSEETIQKLDRLGYCFTPYQRQWLYNGAPLVAFYDTLEIRRTYSRLKTPGVPNLNVIYVNVYGIKKNR